MLAAPTVFGKALMAAFNDEKIKVMMTVAGKKVAYCAYLPNYKCRLDLIHTLPPDKIVVKAAGEAVTQPPVEEQAPPPPAPSMTQSTVVPESSSIDVGGLLWNGSWEQPYGAFSNEPLPQCMESSDVPGTDKYIAEVAKAQDSPLLALCFWHCASGIVLLALCFWHCAPGIVLLELCF
ncbi:hypothetical protein P389DRAFT_35778 [Cystobasidium minutum MCA 4210]|uniref:uncharacterized protein n=1 Tax=Cystobasidium minutum MCA 4210 TaxID=1397322 RepID=UPI0034CF9669|eukprot:jgi/Rhomi1/35778/CE35777_2609